MFKKLRKIGLLIVIFAICWGVLSYFYRKGNRHIWEREDVVSIARAIICYVERHGSMPSSWDDLIEAKIVRRFGENSLEVLEISEQSSWEVEDIRRYKVTFGPLREGLEAREHTLLDREGSAVYLISPRGDSYLPSLKLYEKSSWWIFMSLKKQQKD